MLWCQTYFDCSYTHRQTVAVMVSYDSILCDLHENEVYGEFFGEPNSSPREVRGADHQFQSTFHRSCLSIVFLHGAIAPQSWLSLYMYKHDQAPGV